ncbi:MAG: PIG-L family deacetylase [Bacteroidales bacterium]
MMLINTGDSVPTIPEKSVPAGNTLVLAPHPDDEVFGCGGAILMHLQQNDAVKVLIVTDGGFPVSNSQRRPDYPEIRKQESLAAAEILGYGQPEFLDFEDGSLQADEKLISRLLEIIRKFQPQNIYLPAGTEIHPDHLALNKAGIEAATRCFENINLFCYEIGQPLRPNFFLDITQLQPRLDRAMDCFASQLAVQDYKIHICSLHAYRSYTLGKEVKFAEAYRLIQSNELKTGEMLWQEKQRDEAAQPSTLNTGEDFPLISVIVRTMNRPQLPEALESIAAQTYQNVEVLVVDARGEKPLNLGDRCGRFPLRVISLCKPLNRPEAANAGLDAVKGEFFSFLDEDDLILPHHIMNLYHILKNSTAPAAYNITEKIDASKTVIDFKLAFNHLKLYWCNYIPNMAVLYRSKVISKGAEFDAGLEIYEDWDFVLQVAEMGKFVFLPEKGGIYRDNNASGVQNNRELINIYRKKIYQKWIPALDRSQLTELLMEFDYFEIGDLNHHAQIKRRCSKLVEENDILKAGLKKHQSELSLTRERNKRLSHQLQVVSEQYRQKKTELQIHRSWQNSFIRKTENSKSPKIGRFFFGLIRFLNLFATHHDGPKSGFTGDHILIKESGLFNELYYLQHNPDTKAKGVNPLDHYLIYGGFEGRNPSPQFDSAFYLNENPDVSASGINPLVHYLKYGKKEGRLPIQTLGLAV